MAQGQYITVTEFEACFDTRLLADLASDSGVPATVDETNTNLLTAIDRASGEVEASALRGGRYSLANLSSLLADEDWAIKGMTAALAMKYLYLRRGDQIPQGIADEISEAMQKLERLRRGELVFGKVGSVVTAGQPSVHVLNVGTRAELNLVSDLPFFPQRQARAV